MAKIIHGIYQNLKKWYVDEEWSFSLIGNDETMLNDFVDWANSHTNLQFHRSWNRGDNPYMSGHSAYCRGIRLATDEEIKSRKKKLAQDKTKEEKRKKQSEVDKLKRLEKAADKAGFKLVKKRVNK